MLLILRHAFLQWIYYCSICNFIIVCMVFMCMNASTHVGGNQKITLEGQFTPLQWYLRIELGSHSKCFNSLL